MTIYIILFIIIAVFSLIERNISDKFRRNVFIINCIGMIGVAAFRSYDASPWPDTINYANFFDVIRVRGGWDVFDLGEWEPGFMTVLWGTGKIFDNNRIFIVLLTLITLVPIFKSIWKYSKLPNMSLAVFIAHAYYTNTSLYRQYCAVALLTFSYKYIQERRVAPFLGVIALATLFHRTAIIFVFAYIIYNNALDIRSVVKAGILSVIVGLAAGKIFQYISVFSRVKAEVEYNGGITLLIFFWICLFFVYYVNKNNRKEDSYRLFYTMLVLTVIMQPFVFTFSLWSRVVVYFSISLVYLLPNSIYKLCEKNMADHFSKVTLKLSMFAVLFLHFIMLVHGQYKFM